RELGSVTGNFPVLVVDGAPIHEALAICEWTAEHFPEAGLWPEATLARAQARALACEMASGFFNLRTHMSSHPLARVPHFPPDGSTRVESARVHGLRGRALQASGGPFVFGRISIADAMGVALLMRFEPSGLAHPAQLTPYAETVHGLPVGARWGRAAAIA